LRAIDFQTLFDWFAYDRVSIGSGGLTSLRELYSQYPNILDQAIEQCPTILTGEQYVCTYGE